MRLNNLQIHCNIFVLQFFIISLLMQSKPKLVLFLSVRIALVTSLRVIHSLKLHVCYCMFLSKSCLFWIECRLNFESLNLVTTEMPNSVDFREA